MNRGKKMVKWKWEKWNVIKYATWNVRGIVHKEEELDNVLNKKHMKIAVITVQKGNWRVQWKQIIK